MSIVSREMSRCVSLIQRGVVSATGRLCFYVPSQQVGAQIAGSARCRGATGFGSKPGWLRSSRNGAGDEADSGLAAAPTMTTDVSRIAVGKLSATSAFVTSSSVVGLGCSPSHHRTPEIASQIAGKVGQERTRAEHAEWLDR